MITGTAEDFVIDNLHKTFPPLKRDDDLTKERALELCLRDWVWIAMTGDKKEHIRFYNKLTRKKGEIIPIFRCWTCEYVERRLNAGFHTIDNAKCSICPLRGYAWGERPDSCQVTCCEPNSPYREYEECESYSDRAKHGWEMVTHIQNALAMESLRQMNEV